MRDRSRCRKDIRLCIDSAQGLKGLLWLSFLPGGGISAGFFDKAFIVPALISHVGDIPRSDEEVLDLETIHGCESITNPHFTLHAGDPPSHFHLKSQNGTVLCEALVWVHPFPGEEISPWIRFISNPISELSRFQRPAHGRNVEIMKLISPRKDCSVAVHLDFATSTPHAPHPRHEFARYFHWSQVTLRVLAFCVSPQSATLGYEIK